MTSLSGDTSVLKIQDNIVDRGSQAESLTVDRGIICRLCGQRKPRSEFYIHEDDKYKYRRRCQSCQDLINAAHAKKEKLRLSHYRKQLRSVKAKGKRCHICKCWKPKSEFYKDRSVIDGYTHQCKSCLKIKNAKWRTENPEYARELQDRWKRKNREKIRKINNKARKVHRSRYPERAYAQGVLNSAKQSGRIIPQPCRWPKCGSTERIEGHHLSYLKPFEIVWLCHAHHKAADACNGKLGFELQVDVIPAPRKCTRSSVKGMEQLAHD